MEHAVTSRRNICAPLRRLRDKAYISEKYHARRVGPGTAQRYELPWSDDELYRVYSLGQRFVFFIQASNS